MHNWSSSDTATAEVDANGFVTSKKIGNVTITATSDSGVQRTCLIHFCYPVTSVTFASGDQTLKIGRSTQLNVEVSSRTDIFTNKFVTFTSSDSTVAKVDKDGLVTAMGPGNATITAASGNGYSDTCIVTVSQANILTLPASLSTIGSEAFAGLPKVDAVRIPASVQSIAEDAFSSTDVILFAPLGSSAAMWGKAHGFTVIEE